MNEDFRDKNSHGATETQNVAGTQSDNLSNQISPEKNILEQEQKMSFDAPRLRASARGNWKRVKLGEVAEEYSVRNKDKRLSNVFSVTNSQGFTPSTDYFKKEVFSKELSTYKIVEEGMLAYNPSRINVGSVACLKLSERVIVSPLYVVVSINRYLVSPSFLEYALHSEFALSQIASLTSGSVRDSLKYSAFEKIEIPLPPLEEQRRIAGTLDKVRELIDLRERELAKFDELVKCRFIEMFGCYVERKCLRDYAFLITKGASPKWQGVDYCEKGVLFVTSENVREGYLDLSKKKYLDSKINEIQPRSILKRSDILINIVGASIGRSAVYDCDENANINQAVALVRVDYSKINQSYLMTYLNSSQAIEMYCKMKKGGARDNLSLQNIENLEIPVAPLSLQEEFARFVAAVDKSKFAVRQSLEKLKICYKSLMQEYFG